MGGSHSHRYVVHEDPLLCTFIGIRVPLRIGEELEGVREAIEPFFEGSFTPNENLHVTLKFLGPLTDAMLTQVKRALLDVEIERTRLNIEGFGSFSKRIIWAKVSGLETIHERVDDALRGLFEPEKRFMGHMTLARIRRCTSESGLCAALKALYAPIGWYPEGIEIIRSQSDAKGTRYETQARYLAKAYRSI